MLTKSNIILEDFEAMSAEHESALLKIRAAAESEEKRAAWKIKRGKKFTSSNCHRLTADLEYFDLNDLIIEEIRDKYKPRGNDKYSAADLATEYDVEESLIRKIIKPDFVFKDHLPQGAITYIEEIVVEILTDGKGKKEFKNDSMDRGSNTELEAIGRAELELGLKFYATGDDQDFIELCSYFGGTPDGLFNEDGLIEVKCPDSKTHLFYLRNLKSAADLKKHCANYYWQIQGNFLATGRNVAYFISYDDRFTNPEHQILILKIERNDEDIEKLKKRLAMAERHKQQLLKFG